MDQVITLANRKPKKRRGPSVCQRTRQNRWWARHVLLLVDYEIWLMPLFTTYHGLPRDMPSRARILYHYQCRKCGQIIKSIHRVKGLTNTKALTA